MFQPLQTLLHNITNIGTIGRNSVFKTVLIFHIPDSSFLGGKAIKLFQGIPITELLKRLKKMRLFFNTKSALQIYKPILSHVQCDN